MKERELASEATYRKAYRPRRTPERYDHEVVVFRLAGETYGLDITHLREVIRPLPVAELPRVPPYLLGVATLRGVVVPIVDLRRRLGLPAPAPTRAARVLVASVAGEPLGLLVDAVRGVLRLRSEQIEPAPTGAGGDEDHLAGLAHSGDELIILLSPAPLLGAQGVS